MKQYLWIIPIAHWTGMIAAALAIYLLAQGGASAWWAALWFVGHLAGGLAVSVGLHRYFTHGAFKTSRFWHWVLALYGTLTLQGSPLGWAAAHQTHHVHSDTERDVHLTRWHYLIWKRYRDVPMVMWRARELVSDRAIRFTHRYALPIVAAWCALLLGLGALTGTGYLPLLFGYLAPLGTTQIVGAVHQVTSHRGGGARDLPLLELVLPAAGEWYHKFHHDKPWATRLGRLDYGWWFIRLIRR